MKQLLQLDKYFFKLVNDHWTNSFFDWLMPWLRNPPLWIPLYVFLVLFIVINYKKKGIWLIGLAILTAILTDSISSHLIKPWVARLRPCNDPGMIGSVRLLLGYAPGNGSFTSSHAANHFGLAMFLVSTLRKKLGNGMFLFYLWAFAICYAQVYVGIHYPLDVIGGAVVGCLTGYFMATVFNNKIGVF